MAFSDNKVSDEQSHTLTSSKRKPDDECSVEVVDDPRKKTKPTEISVNNDEVEDNNDKDEDEDEDEDEDVDEEEEAVVVDMKGKGIMKEDKGKGKLEVEDDSDDDDEDGAEYLSDGDSDLSDDPLAEVDLDNILPSRTRRRAAPAPGMLLANDLEGEDDSDDSDA